MGTWSCTGEQSTLAVSHWSLKALVGLRVPTPAVKGTVGAPASSLLGSRRLRSIGTQYLLGAQEPWLRQVHVTLVVARHFAFFCVRACACVCVCVCMCMSDIFLWAWLVCFVYCYTVQVNIRMWTMRA